VDTPKHENVVLRREIGEVLRGVRQHQGRTLREVSDRIALTEGVMIPDTVPDELVRQQGVALR
jgi:transcriptional regulator, XRE family protein